ncbi:MAG: CBS domain-containing protein [Lewinellaceae bacterium]|nr:CBS domain-containing protein [Lewinellaceae bacterium]
MDDSRSRRTLLQIGGHALPATLLLTTLAALAAFWIVPMFSFLLGSGWAAPLFVGVLLFLLLLLFRKTLLRHAWQTTAEADEALLEYFVQQNSGAGPGEEVAVELLENALHLKTIRARDCMAPRPEIVCHDVNAPLAELRRSFVESGLSRILVIGGTLDNVLGYVHVQQMFAHPRHVRDLVLPITFVPETMVANDLLHKFIRKRTNIACVVDEYGGLAGLVTLEDALEQLFGEIDDEHDRREFVEEQLSESEYRFSGRLKIEHLNDKYPALQLPLGDYHTLSGYLVTTSKTIPEQGDRLELDGKTFILELVSERKIETVRVLL